MRGNIWKVPELDRQAESGQAIGDSPAPPRPPPRWWSSIWFWPGAAIGLAGIAGTLFGSIGVILGGEALAALAVAAGILFFSRDRWLTLGLAVALAACLVIFGGSIRWHELHNKSSHRVLAAAATGAPQMSADWPRQRISQTIANRANFRGADLDGADLDGLHLSRKNLDGVQADGASFRGSQLEYASLRGASLRGACLEGANLTGADLTGADFTGADVAGVTVSRQAKRAALVWPSAHATPTAICY
jgi:Pentapeptide repeats (8 copies)